MSVVKSRFDTILVPVDFSANTEVAIHKALLLCEKSSSVIHLLHIARPGKNRGFDLQQYYAKTPVGGDGNHMTVAAERLEKLKEYILRQKSTIEVICWTVTGSPVEKAIIEKAGKLSADLVIIGKSSHHNILHFLNTVVPSRISKRSGVAVFTVKPGSLNKDIKTVVVPVGEKFPIDKLEWINCLRKKFRFRVRLVSFASNDHFLPGPLLEAYWFLKTNLANDVSYKILKGTNKTRAILKYCKWVEADVVVVYPDAETRLGWLSGHLSDALPLRSPTQVLAVQPERKLFIN